MLTLSDKVQELVDQTIESSFMHKKDNDGDLFAIQLFTGSNGLQSITNIVIQEELEACAQLFGGICDHTLIYITDTWSLNPQALKEDPDLALKFALGQVDLGEAFRDPANELHKWITECLVIQGFYDDSEEFVVRVPYTEYEGEYIHGDQVVEDPANNPVLKNIRRGRESFPAQGEAREHWRQNTPELLSTQLYGHVAAAHATHIHVEIAGEEMCEELWGAILVIAERLAEKIKEHRPDDAEFCGRIAIANEEGVRAVYPNDE